MIRSGWQQILRWNKPRASTGAVLVTVLAVMVILLILFFAAFTFVASRYSHHVREQNRLIAKNLSEAGLTRWLQRLSQNQLAFESILFNSPNGGKVNASLSAWGPYALVTSNGIFANQTVTSQSIIGSKPNKLFDAAITVGDESLPLVASGNTRIFGDVNTGELGMTTGRMRGESIVNEDFHSGHVIIHQTITVPTLDTLVLNQYLSSVNSRRQQCDQSFPGSMILTANDSGFFNEHECFTIENNLRIQGAVFENFDKVHSVFVNGFVELAGNCRLSGLIEIVSTGPMYVLDSAVVDNLILITPDSVVISGNSTFSATAISSQKIVVKEKARLLYPSILLIRDREDLSDMETGIFLQSRSKMESVCFSERNPSTEDRTNPVIYLDSASSFTGIIIAQSKADLRGTLNGSVFTERFHYFASPTTYVNWIKDLKIDRTKLDYHPVLPLLDNATDSNDYSILRSDYLP